MNIKQAYYSKVEQKKQIDIFQNSNEQAKTEKNISVFMDINESGERIIGVLYGEKTYYLNSRYKEDLLVESWCDQEEISNYRTIVLVFGIANGSYIRRLRERNKEMLILVYEPSYSIAQLDYDEIGIQDLIEDDNMIIVVGKDNCNGVYQILNSVVQYEAVRYIKFLISPNYEHIFGNELKEIKDIYLEAMTRVVFNRNTIITLGNELTHNISANLIDCIKQYSLENLVKEMDKLDKNGLPAIIVAAGPSLDKNIMELKKAKGKAFIIAVDTALNPLADADIIPDIAVTVDPHKPLSLFQNEKMKNIPLIYLVTSNEKIKDVHTGMRIYYDSDPTVLTYFLKKFKKKQITLETGGSVAHNAFSLAQVLGFKTIVFVGQDLAYPNDKEHAEAAYKDQFKNDIKNINKTYFEVEDIYGGKVKTESNMNQYRMWLEQAVLFYQDIHFIDATEGGAKKKGMEILTLRETIERECKRKDDIDFSSIIAKTQHFFSDSEQMDIFESLMNYDQVIDKVKRKMQNGIKAYKELEKLNNKNELQGKKFEDVVKKVTKINQWVTDNSDIAYLNVYVALKDFQVRDVILDEKESIKEELQLVTDNGIGLLEDLIKATDTFMDDMGEVMKQAKVELNYLRK